MMGLGRPPIAILDRRFRPERGDLEQVAGRAGRKEQVRPTRNPGPDSVRLVIGVGMVATDRTTAIRREEPMVVTARLDMATLGVVPVVLVVVRVRGGEPGPRRGQMVGPIVGPARDRRRDCQQAGERGQHPARGRIGSHGMGQGTAPPAERPPAADPAAVRRRLLAGPDSESPTRPDRVASCQRSLH